MRKRFLATFALLKIYSRIMALYGDLANGEKYVNEHQRHTFAVRLAKIRNYRTILELGRQLAVAGPINPVVKSEFRNLIDRRRALFFSFFTLELGVSSLGFYWERS